MYYLRQIFASIAYLRFSELKYKNIFLIKIILTVLLLTQITLSLIKYCFPFANILYDIVIARFFIIQSIRM